MLRANPTPRATNSKLDQTDPQINLGLGHPSDDLLPTDLLRRAAEVRLAESATPLLQYGSGQGNADFLGALGDFLADAHGVSISPEHLLVTNGASQALDLICTVLTQPGDTVFVGEPSYFLALGIFAEHGLNVVSIPVDSEGVQTAALEEALAQHAPVFFYTIPTFQNPSGVTLSASRRERLLELSRAYNFFIIADEVYQLLNFAAERPALLATLAEDVAEDAKVFSLGSFSKILAPGLRLGWIQASEAVLEPLIHSGLLTSGGGLNPFTSGLVRVILERGWQAEHLDSLREVYRGRANVLVSALREHIPEAQFDIPEGGYFVWVRLEDTDTNLLHKEAERHGVSFQAGERFSSQNSLQNALRLSFSHYSPDAIREGVGRLRAALDALS